MNAPLRFPGPRPRPIEQRSNLLAPGRNCWRIERAHRASWLIDGAEYFSAVRSALAQAQSTIFIIGWDIDSRVRLVPTGANDGFPEALGDFLAALLASRPQLNAYILSWDFALLFALEREWLTELKLASRTQRRLNFQLDDRHPTGASHHQKLIVVDDAVAFVSGFDLTRNRWDTSEHRLDDPRRRNADGSTYSPFHDIGMVVDGDVASALGELARERWYTATGRHARHRQTGIREPRWPAQVEARLVDVDVAISRTEPRFEGRAGVFEVRELHLDAIAAAKFSLFAENQYFTSRTIATALEARLREPQGPDIVVVSPSTQSGWLETSTMGVLRSRIHGNLVRADSHGRYRVYCPWLEDGAGEHTCLNVHSKILIVDDELLTIGSANLSGRSMGLDTECNLAIEAKNDERISRAIATLRNRLLGEHLDRDAAAVEEAIQNRGGLIAGIEALRSKRRSMKPLTGETGEDWSALVPDHAVLDPEEPIDVERLMEEVVSRGAKRPLAMRSLVIVLLIVFLSALALAWRYTPLRDFINAESLAQASAGFAQSPFSPLAVFAAYFGGGLIMVPVTVMIAVTGIIFGPLLGFAYALIGETLAAIATYFLGRKLGRATVRRVAGKRINDLSRRIAKRGLIAVVLVRVLPVAPFTIINLIAGASHIAFRDFLLGTIIGMAPGTLVLVVFVDRIVAAVRDPGPLSFGLLALIAGVALGGALALRARLDATPPKRHARQPAAAKAD
ncbi:MAG: VTT domain-containing protein [Pseudomonadota bacterium]|nr:VTT domain-containing protein [Pseudomonadota bacterium]